MQKGSTEKSSCIKLCNKRKLVLMSLIYILEDDKNIQEIERYAIKGSGYEVRAFDDAEAFDRGMREMKPDLLLLDVMLPGENGLSVLKRLRPSARWRRT